MKTLFIEFLVMAILGVLSISEGIRLVLRGKLHHHDVLGPGYYSIGLGSVLIVVGLIYFAFEKQKARTTGHKSAVGRSAGKSEYQKMMISMIVVMIAYILLVYLIGYLFASLAFFFLINRIAGFRSWLTDLGVTVLMTGSFYLIFVTWLDMIFPRGLLFNF